MTEHHVQLPRSIWDRINWWHLGGTIIMGAFVAGVTWAKIGSDRDATAKQISDLSQQITDVKTQNEKQVVAAEGNFKAINQQISDIPYRMGLTEKALEEVNKRMDRIVDSFSTKLDKMLDNQARTDTKVEVISSQVEDLKKSISNKITWKETSLFPIPILREVSFKPCYLPERPGYTVVKSHYRVAPPSSQTAAR